jgi:inorganic pyrophosphatase
MLRNVLSRMGGIRGGIASSFANKSAALSLRSASSSFSLTQQRWMSTSNISAVQKGEANTKEFALFFEQDGKPISPWHDIALESSDAYNFVNEIPKGEKAKMEVNLKQGQNPIVQDIKKGNLRFFTYGDIPFNYGCLPQTWENPHEAHQDTKLPGDDDPVDVVEISDYPITMGDVTEVKVIGCLAMIDEGETDWKVLAIAKSNPLYAEINDEASMEQHMPGKLDVIRDWFIMYKTTDGKGENFLEFDGKLMDANYTKGVIEECHESWVQLRNGSIEAEKDSGKFLG